MIFDGFPGGPRTEGALPVRGILVLPWAPLAITKQSGVALRHADYIIKLAGIKGCEKARMQITKYENQGCNMISVKQRNQDTG